MVGALNKQEPSGKYRDALAKRARDLGERELISQYVLRAGGGVTKSDDCAVIPLNDRQSLLFTTDAGPTRSFLSMLDVGTLADLGHYFATMSISDIAAMGGKPLAVVAACLLDGDFLGEDFGQLVVGLSSACEENDATYVGGDTKEGIGLRVVTSAIGIIDTDRILWRNGAEVGNLLFVTGEIGAALSSYIAAAKGKPSGLGASVRRPRARVDVGSVLSAGNLATACIDMSDGPIAAARELGEQGGVTVELNTELLPIPTTPSEKISENDWKNLIYNVGGDYELMFTAKSENISALRRLGAIFCGTVLKATDGGGVRLAGNSISIQSNPWEHFRSADYISNLVASLV